MAKIYPEHPSPKILGEKNVLDVLQKKLVDSWHIFHEPSLEGDNPDFILFSPYYGILVLEVKDYKLNTIQQMTIDIWTIKVEETPKKITSPLKQVREYTYKLINLLEQSSRLITSSGQYQGRLKFPVTYSCWFTNLTLEDVRCQNINKIIPEKWIFTADDFFAQDIESKIIKIIDEKFSIPELTNEVLPEIQSILYPQIIVDGYEEQRKRWFERLRIRVKFFPNIVDEILFIATVIRDEFAKGVTLDNIYIYYFADKFTKKRFIADEISSICSSMGIRCSLLGGIGDGVCILPFDKLKTHISTDVIFIMDISLSGLNEERELSLKKLLNVNSLNINMSSSDFN